MRRVLIGAALAALVAGVADAQPIVSDNASYQAPVPITVGTTVLARPSRGVAADCAGGGVVTLTFANGASMSWTVAPGHQNQPYAITGISASTASCTYYGLY